MMSGTSLWLILTAATLAAAGFAFLEWRRADRQHLATRLSATILAVTALALLGLRPTWKHSAPSPAGGIHALLWTSSPSASTPPPGVDPHHRFTLPTAQPLAPDASPVPDAAFLRRHFPEIGTLHIFGDGFDPSELDALRGLRVEFTPPPPADRLPGIRFLHCPRELPLGDPLIIQGRLGGLAPHTGITLTLDSPDGTVTRAVTTPADPTGDAPFTLQTPSPPAVGRFLWHLRTAPSPGLPPADFPLGVAVTPPDLPRLLILENAPRFDTAALRRWYEAAHGTLVSRTQLGQDRYRYASAPPAPPAPPAPFAALDAPFLAGVDLLLADTRSLLALPPAERDALQRAITDTGLGLLILPDDAPLPPADPTPLLPWKLSPLASDPPGADRSARLQWPGQLTPTELPIPAAPFEILPGAPAQHPLLGDRQGHMLAAVFPLGRGQLALTLVRDTTRWQRENDPAAFAAYWSFLFSRLARPADPAATGHWTLADGDAGPVFADHPLELLWSSAPAAPTPGPALVITAPSTPSPTTLALAPDPAEPGRWHATFWPRRPGWHHVALASDGPGLDFHVSAADAWPVLAAERRRLATARFAETSSVSSTSPVPPATRQELPPLWLATLFFVAAGYLWAERRFST